MFFDIVNNIICFYNKIYYFFIKKICNVAFVISDSHSTFNKFILNQIKGAEIVIHAGDWSTPEDYEDLKLICGKLYSVHGNTETAAMYKLLPEILEFKLFGKSIFLKHEFDKLGSMIEGKNVDLVIFGHTHKSYKKKLKGTLFYNPGSCGPKRFSNVAPSYGVIYFFKNKFFVRTHKIYGQRRRGYF